jgi:dienelactone hydrolase
MGQDLDYRDTNGKRHVGYLALPASPNGAGIVIAHSAPGLDDHERAVSDRLAGLGYTVLAADYHGDGAILGGETLGARMGTLMGDPAVIRTAIAAAHATLLEQPNVDPARIALVGYCFGGFASLEYARGGADVQAVAGFHATLPTERPEDARAIKAKVLILNATIDPYVPMDSRIAFEAAMNDAGVDWRMVLYGGAQHGFTMQDADKFGMPGIGYHEPSDRRSWAEMLALFAETIDG